MLVHALIKQSHLWYCYTHVFPIIIFFHSSFHIMAPQECIFTPQLLDGFL